MSRITMTAQLAYAIGRDAGNANMRKHGRKVWNREDYNAAARATDAVTHLVPGWTEANPIDCRPPAQP